MSSQEVTQFNLIFAVFSVLFVLQFALRQFLLPVLPFMPSPSSSLVTAAGLAGTFSVAGVAVMVSVLTYAARVPLRWLYFAAVTLAVWGGVVAGLVYPDYYYSAPWITVALLLVALSLASMALALRSLSVIEIIAMLPFVAAQAISLISYVLNVLEEYMGFAIGQSLILPYITLYMAVAGALTSLAMSFIAFRPRPGVMARYAVAAALAFGISFPLYSLTANNVMMQHIMDMVFALGLGILTTPTSVPLISALMGVYAFSIVSLLANPSDGHRYMYDGALMAVLMATAVGSRALAISFASVIAASVSVYYARGRLSGNVGKAYY